MKHWQIYLLVLLALVIIGGAGYLGFQVTLPFTQQETPEPVEVPPTVAVSRGEVQQTIITPGQLVNYQTIDIPAGITGPVEVVNVRPGEAVQTGEELVRLGGREQLEMNVASAEIALLEAQKALGDLHEAAKTNKIQALEAITQYITQVKDAQYMLDNFTVPSNQVDLEPMEGVEVMKATLDQVREAFEPYKYYSPGNTIRQKLIVALNLAQSDYNTAVRRLEYVNELEIAQSNLEKAQHDYDTWVKGPDPGDVNLTEAHIDNANAALEEATRRLEDLVINAPFDGVILAVSVQVGEMVGEGSHVLQMSDPRALEVLVSIVEEDYPLVAVGQPVELYFDAAPELEITGKVERIIPKRIEGSLPQYQVDISIDNIPETVVEGMTADAAIILEKQNYVLRLPRALVQANSDGTATVSVWMGTYVEERDLTVGLRGDMFVEILSGLEEGEQVVGQ
jgi:multidrug efflux pump subunit AcrA (membrane-fusion protein)